MVKQNPPLLVLLALQAIILISACSPSKTVSAYWSPAKFPEIISPNPKQTVDVSLLADMVTIILSNNFQFQEHLKIKPITAPNIAIHPERGPFLFELGNKLIVVADTSSRAYDLANKIPYSELFFIKLQDSNTNEQISLLNNVEKISLTAQSLHNPNNKKGKIHLTPENIAAALSNFSKWEGVHLDEKTNALTFIGSNESLNNPQISASDLIAAYQAIFQYEAMGEPLFVDMDFNYKKEEYLVTFGGGFEDTNPGRILYEADLLLKGLSSGIDPWSNEKPLIDLMCNDNKSTQIQQLYCKYFWKYWDKNNRDKNKDKEIDHLINTYYSKIIAANELVNQASIGGDNENAWGYLINADQLTMEKVIKEVESFGYFTNEKGNKYCVNDFRGCNKEATMNRIKELAKLDSNEKSIVKTAKSLYPPPTNNKNKYLYIKYDFDIDLNQDKRRDFARLSIFSSKIYDYLSKCSNSDRENIFNLFQKLKNPYGKGSLRSLRAEIALLLFMSKEKGFIQDFATLNDEHDQMLIAFIASTILDPQYARMLDKLQFQQPLCSDKDNNTTNINDFNTAFKKFTCGFLSKYKRPYLADIIRGEFSKYQSAAEIGSQEEIYQQRPKDSLVTVRYWFYPGQQVITLADSSNLNTFLFHKPNMEAKAERIETRLGPWAAPVLTLDMPGIQENLNLINNNYEDLSDVFPVMKELNNLVKMLAFFRWIRYYQSENFDLGAFVNAADYGTPTPRTYPVYETVVALPDGSLMRAIGGVDLHSATQVGFNSEKINGFISAMNYNKPNKNIYYNSKNYILSTALTSSISLKNTVEQTKSITKEEQNIVITSSHEAYTSVAFNVNNQLKWSWTTTSNSLLERPFSVYSSFSDGKAERNVYQAGQTTIKKQKIEHEKTFLNSKLVKQEDKQIQLQEQLILNLTELAEANAPEESIWALFSIPFEHARFTAKNGEHLFIFREDFENQYWIGKRNDAGQYTISKISKVMAESWMAQTSQNPPFSRTTQTKIISLQLTSTEPTDSILGTRLNHSDANLLNVHITGTKTCTHNLIEWRALTSNNTTPTFCDENEKNNFIFYPSVFERKKGKIQNFDLTNRSFLVDEISNLRGKTINKNLKFSFWSQLPFQNDIDELLQEPWQMNTNRFYIFDTLGFNPENKIVLLDLAAQYPQKIFIFSLSNAPISIPDQNFNELIWLSCLQEKQTQTRLEIAQSYKLLQKVCRIRIFNVGNPVFDLGNNLFIEEPQLLRIGAWQRILDIETVLTLVKLLVESREQELDTQLALVVNDFKYKSHQGKATTSKLRLARKLEDALFSWEEIRSFKYSSSNWKIK